jgi:hypothetical protein
MAHISQNKVFVWNLRTWNMLTVPSFILHVQILRAQEWRELKLNMNKGTNSECLQSRQTLIAL